MASVVCPHCSSKIRLTRKKKSSPATHPESDSTTEGGSQETEQKGKKPPRLSVPELPVPETKLPDAIEPEVPAVDIPTISTRRKRPKVSFDGLEIDDSVDSELSDLDSNETQDDDDIPKIVTRRKRMGKGINLNNLDFDELDSEPPNFLAPQPPPSAEPEETPPEIKTRSNQKQTKPAQRKPETPAAKLQPPAQPDTVPPDVVPKRRSLNPPAPSSGSSREANSKASPKPTAPAPSTPEPIAAQPKSRPSIADQPINDSEKSETEVSPSKPLEPGDQELDSADDLLPPKFLVADIEADKNAVVLPTAGGGFQVVDKTEVRVMHEGRAVKLVSLSPDELKRVRLIENLVALLIAAVMLAIAAWLVL